ncbi:MAG: Gfo/Idh/MocA family oxidoreductase [Chryseolinea sp.]
MNKIRWGILGCGKIANKFAADLRLVEDALLTVVASRDKERSMAFAKVYGVPVALDSYEALVTSDQVDVIYVATPHGFHYNHVMLCLHNGKAVLCEKALALNSRQVAEMVKTSREKKVFLMEAFWTKFLPQYKKVTEMISADTIGEIRMIEADFGFRASEPTPQRLYDPNLGGGALLDIGIYPVFLAISLLGRPASIIATMNAFPSGVDSQISMTLKFDSGALAILGSSFETETPVEATISGMKGYIGLRDRFHNATSNVILALGKDKPVAVEVHRETGHGYQFEARHVTECLQKNLIESPIMKLEDSILLMETLDRIRKVCGIRYAAD